MPRVLSHSLITNVCHLPTLTVYFFPLQTVERRRLICKRNDGDVALPSPLSRDNSCFTFSFFSNFFS